MTRGKAEKHEKMPAKEFAVLISSLGFRPLDVAQLWGTSEDRVVEWMHGEKEIPFAMWWILLPLRDEKVFNTVQEIVEKHTSIRPQWATYKALQEHLRSLAPQVLAAQGRIAAEIERWETEHRHKHPYSDAIGRIDAVMQDSEIGLRERLEILEGIAAAFNVRPDA